MSAWNTWSRLSGAERFLLIQAVALVAAVRVTLWVMPSRWIVRAVQRLVGGETPSAVRHPPSAVRRPPSDERTPAERARAEGGGRTADGVVWAVSAASRRIPDATCLTQAVAALLLLRRAGHDARFVVGVARGGSGALEAHAWLERDGKVIIGRTPQMFVRFPDLARPHLS